jgi:hypothetical protein
MVPIQHTTSAPICFAHIRHRVGNKAEHKSDTVFAPSLCTQDRHMGSADHSYATYGQPGTVQLWPRKWDRFVLGNICTDFRTASVSNLFSESAPKSYTPVWHVSATISGGGQVCDVGGHGHLQNALTS